MVFQESGRWVLISRIWICEQRSGRSYEPPNSRSTRLYVWVRGDSCFHEVEGLRWHPFERQHPVNRPSEKVWIRRVYYNQSRVSCYLGNKRQLLLTIRRFGLPGLSNPPRRRRWCLREPVSAWSWNSSWVASQARWPHIPIWRWWPLEEKIVVWKIMKDLRNTLSWRWSIGRSRLRL